MSKCVGVVNELLVETFNDILQIEHKALKEGILKDLSITEVHTIDAIGMYEYRTMTQVSQDLKITLGTLTTAVSKLLKKGYVDRKRGEEDRRSVMIALTRKGKLAYRIHDKFHSHMVHATIDVLNEEEEEVLIKSLEKLNNFFKEKYKLEG
ncbi:MarR family transcriptional regulator [Clostridium tagluense]|uniref:MarR family winged helix-turn-helix transcriptional regulator n=1 Tax=Clostridium tagluense TaxID=360422 RepID=UPI001CF4191E|nr:MarR family transcriptional regulator [Clostridium tagluense]MCB2311256.1 MarR family transcriptional regulator [Clostridium tagluense]MCB2316102.1 MarR family transcriptional regulator [Clostridium tagluense]MCB2320832.1 MarR family transcriptional regulator [Clostridium tagluense]MCB2325971.1 MarR family transcriptional regulator [Clostridium tagluense]MCB2330572.1 MarR family transcriptional regulator [Clostridium tagluense]